MKYVFHALLIWSLTSLAWAAPSQEATRYYEDALGYFNKAEYITAVIQLKNALQISPEYLPARLLLGEALLRQGDGATAEKEIRIAQQTGGAPSLTLLPLAKALNQQKKYAELINEIPATRLSKDQQSEIRFLRAKPISNWENMKRHAMPSTRHCSFPGAPRFYPQSAWPCWH